MSNRVNSSLGYGPVPPFPGPGGKPSQPSSAAPWNAGPPNPNDMREVWAWQRRCDLTQIATPILMGLMRPGEQHAGASESWTPEGFDPEAADQALVTRAARLALLFQEALDRAKPRP